MDELKAWCERQIASWEAELSMLDEGSMLVQQRDPGSDWKDITRLVVARTRDDVARLRSLLGRMEAGVVVEADEEADAPGPEGGALLGALAAGR